MSEQTPTPWASVKNGKWHRVETMPQNFRDVTKSLCGVSFEPHNVSEGKPDYIALWAFCNKCNQASLATGQATTKGAEG